MTIDTRHINITPGMAEAFRKATERNPFETTRAELKEEIKTLKSSYMWYEKKFMRYLDEAEMLQKELINAIGVEKVSELYTEFSSNRNHE